MLRLRFEGLTGRRQPIELAGHALLPVAAGALYWEAEDTLLVADLHLEKGAAFAARGIMLPPYDTRSTLSRLAACIDVFRPRRVVALGDFSVRAVASSRARRFPLSRRRLGSDSKDIDCRKFWLGGQAVPQIDGEANIAGPQ